LISFNSIFLFARIAEYLLMLLFSVLYAEDELTFEALEINSLVSASKKKELKKKTKPTTIRFMINGKFCTSKDTKK